MLQLAKVSNVQKIITVLSVMYFASHRTTVFTDLTSVTKKENVNVELVGYHLCVKCQKSTASKTSVVTMAVVFQVSAVVLTISTASCVRTKSFIVRTSHVRTAAHVKTRLVVSAVCVEAVLLEFVASSPLKILVQHNLLVYPLTS